MMAQSSRPPPFPPFVLPGTGVLLAVLVVVAATVHGAGAPPADGQVVATRDLRFEDRADGAVLVYDAKAAAPFEVMTGENGFLRGTLRGLARERHSEGVDSSGAFHLTAWRDGRLTLDDMVTGRHVELEAFGQTNAAVFARFLPPVPLSSVAAKTGAAKAGA